VESLATQTLVIFAIRTRRIPFFRSRPSVPPLLAVVAVGSVLPASPFGAMLGFLLLIEVGKYWSYRSSREPTAAPPHSRLR
jgi:P-type Mg2+ transporter